MSRPYSFDHFNAKKPMQAAVGTPDRLGNDEDKQKPLKSELQATQPDTVPGAHQGEIHYGMAHSETVKRLQERRAARAKKEARAAAAKKRPTGTRKAAKTAKAATSESTAKPARTAAKTTRAKPAAKAEKSTKTATATHKTAATARKKTATRAEPATERTAAPAKRPTAKQSLLGRVVDTVTRTALTTGSKGLARAAALAKEVRASRSKAAAKPEKSSGKTDTSKTDTSKTDKSKKR